MLAPLPDSAPGFIVQVPVGKPVSKVLPVATEHVGSVMALIDGADGVSG